MRTLLLPASAAAFAPRSAPTIVLGTKVEPWLTQTLKRINRVKKPLNSVPQHLRCLTETLGSASAIWTICALMLPKKPEAELLRDENPFKEALANFQLLHIEAYVVHVDMVLQHEVAFKLTIDSIKMLIDYHKNIYLVDVAADTWHWNEKESQVKKLHEEFIQAVNRFVYRSHVTALEGLEEDGAGELLSGRSNEVKNQIMGLFLPLLPPPPRIIELVRQPPLLPSSNQGWQYSLPPLQPAPVDAWKVVPSTPSPQMTTVDTSQSLWATSLSVPEQVFGLPSPAPSYSSPYSQAPVQPVYQSMAYSSPYVSQSFPAPVTMAPFTMSEMTMGMSSNLPLPSMYAQTAPTCGAGVMSIGGFEWDTYRADVAF